VAYRVIDWLLKYKSTQFSAQPPRSLRLCGKKTAKNKSAALKPGTALEKIR